MNSNLTGKVIMACRPVTCIGIMAYRPVVTRTYIQQSCEMLQEEEVGRPVTDQRVGLTDVLQLMGLQLHQSNTYLSSITLFLGKERLRDVP